MEKRLRSSIDYPYEIVEQMINTWELIRIFAYKNFGTVNNLLFTECMTIKDTTDCHNMCMGTGDTLNEVSYNLLKDISTKEHDDPDFRFVLIDKHWIVIEQRNVAQSCHHTEIIYY